MNDSARPSPKALNVLGNLLVVTGALVFFVGDRFLREASHWDFWNAEIVGIGSGVVLVMLGGLLSKVANRKGQGE